MAARTGQQLARHALHIDGQPLDTKSGGKETLRGVAAQQGISDQVRMGCDPLDLLRWKAVPAMRARDSSRQRRIVPPQRGPFIHRDGPTDDAPIETSSANATNLIVSIPLLIWPVSNLSCPSDHFKTRDGHSVFLRLVCLNSFLLRLSP